MVLMTYVRPLCDETNLSSARPISGRTVECDFKNSISKSYSNMSV